jgi:hypothetical protein
MLLQIGKQVQLRAQSKEGFLARDSLVGDLFKRLFALMLIYLTHRTHFKVKGEEVAALQGEIESEVVTHISVPREQTGLCLVSFFFSFFVC